MSSSSNAANIALNRQNLFKAESQVERNKTQAYLIRSIVEENHDSILKNYHAAFRGNRNLANANTDDLFRNRYSILRSMKIDSTNQVHTPHPQCRCVSFFSVNNADQCRCTSTSARPN